MHENVIKWLDGEDTISVTLHQKKYVNKVRRLAESDERIEILAENKDGSIFAHLPIEVLKLEKKRRNEIGEERKAELRAMVKSWHKKSEEVLDE